MEAETALSGSGQEMKAYCPVFPERLWIELSNSCNLKCIMCDRRLGPEHTLEYDVFSRVKEFVPAADSIMWQGGEVFCVPYFPRLLREFHELKPSLSSSIMTNGMIMDRDTAALLRDIRAGLAFSIDSVDEELYGKIRPGGSLPRVLKNIELLNEEYAKAGRADSFTLNYVVMKSNCSEIPELPGFCLKNHIRYINLIKLFPAAAPAEDILSAPEKDQIIRDLRERMGVFEEKCRLAGISYETIHMAALIGEDHYPEAKGGFHPENGNTCINPWKSIYIKCDGDITPACGCRKPIGSIYRDSLSSVWNNDIMKAYRKAMIDRKYDSSLCLESCFENESLA